MTLTTGQVGGIAVVRMQMRSLAFLSFGSTEAVRSVHFFQACIM